MKTMIFASALCGVLASSAICQVGIPPHSSIYNGFSRGFNFTAATNFHINKLDLPLDSFQAGDTASYMIHVNGVEVLRSIGNAGAYTLGAPVIIATGDVVDIIGNWSPAATSNFSAHNSYGTGAPFNTMIEGVPHVLNRQGWQWDIGDPAYLNGSMNTPSTGAMGRVLVYTTPPSGLFASFDATPTTGGQGLQVQFTDTSFSSATGGVLSWAWDFGDGGTSTLQHPSHTYSCGFFSPSLTVTDASHPQSMVTRTNFISSGIVTADFTASGTFGSVPYSVTFTDTSTGGPLNWEWDFGDGSTSTAQNPTHIYALGGKFTVTLKVTGGCNNDTEVKTDFIEVCQPGGNSGSLTTYIGGGNGLTAANAGNLFDLDVLNPSGIQITSIDVNDRATSGNVDIQVYITPDTYVNKHLNQNEWTMVSQGSAPNTGGANNTLTPIDVDDFYLAPGKYGVYIIFVTGGIHYTNGNAANSTRQNCDVQFSGGIAMGTPWTGTPFNPRIWNGTIHYSPNDIAANGPYGYGCAGSNALVPQLSMDAEPKIGGTGNIMLTDLVNVPAGGAFLFLGGTKQMFDLGPIGAPGCFLQTDVIDTIGVVNSNGIVTLPFGVPNNVAFVGVQLTMQGAADDPGANTMGVSASAGHSLRVGN